MLDVELGTKDRTRGFVLFQRVDDDYKTSRCSRAGSMFHGQNMFILKFHALFAGLKTQIP